MCCFGLTTQNTRCFSVYKYRMTQLLLFSFSVQCLAWTLHANLRQDLGCINKKDFKRHTACEMENVYFQMRVDWTVTLRWVVQYNASIFIYLFIYIFLFCIVSYHIASHPEVSHHLKIMYVNVTFSESRYWCWLTLIIPRPAPPFSDRPSLTPSGRSVQVSFIQTWLAGFTADILY